ncbi:MAG TPA: GTPase-associated protein 1-related protein [Actinospica sp.]|nr:GTPase-associated protein 1-related protein [Actinospica sp.]
MNPQKTCPPAPSGAPPAALPPTVHRLRLRPAPADPAVLVPVGPVDLAAGLVDRIGRLAESGDRGGGPVLSYGRLPDGGGVLCRLTAPSAETIDEEPCLDVHVVVLPEGAARSGMTPIDTWPEESWPADGVLAPCAWIDRAELVRFAAKVRGRLSSVLADVRDLSNEPAGPQLLLVERRPLDVARWIALICASLPDHIAHELTFTTSATRPYAACTQIVGIPPEAEFSFSEAELRHLYRVRSHEGRCSPASTDPWAEIAARLWQHGRPELINSDNRIPLTEPFDAGRLAAVALLEHLPVGREAELLAADWLSSASTGMMAQQDVDGLMAALTRIDRSALGPPDPRPAPAVMYRMLPAFRALRRRATPEVTAPVALRLGRAALRAALDRRATVTTDPLAGLGLGRAGRRRLQEEFGPEILALLRSPRGSYASPSTMVGGLILATSLRLDLTGPLEPTPDRLAHALSTACAAHDRRTVVALLAQIDERGVTADVLTHLETAAQSGRVFEVAELARFAEGGAWLAHRDVRRYPALRIVLAATDPRGPRIQGFDLFASVWRAELDLRDPGLLAVLSTLSWPLSQELLPPHEAIALGTLLPAEVLYAGGFDGRLRATFERCLRDLSPGPSPSTLRDAVDLSATILKKQINLGARSHAAATLLAKLKSGDLTSLVQDLEQPHVAPSVRQAALQELSNRLARGTVDLMLRDPEHAAGCFYVWTEAAGAADPAAPGHIESIITPALLRADHAWKAAVSSFLTTIASRSEHIAAHWDNLATQHSPAE